MVDAVEVIVKQTYKTKNLLSKKILQENLWILSKIISRHLNITSRCVNNVVLNF